MTAVEKRKDRLLGNRVSVQEGHLLPFFSSHTKINFRWITGLNLKTRKLLEGITGLRLCELNAGAFLKQT